MSQEFKGLLIGIVCAVVVTTIAFRLDGIGPHGWNNFRWFIAGTSCAAMVINAWAFRRTVQHKKQWRASMDRTAAEFADAVKRELNKRGLDGEVEVSDKPPWPLH